MKMASFIVGWRAGVPHMKMASFIVGCRAGVPHMKMASFIGGWTAGVPHIKIASFIVGRRAGVPHVKMASFIVGWRAGVPHVKMASFIVGWRAGVPHVKMASFRSPVVTQPTGEPFQAKRKLDTQTGLLSSFCHHQNQSWKPRQDCCPVVVTIRWSRTASGPQWPMTEPLRGTGKLPISPNPDHSLNVGDVKPYS